MVKIKDIAKSFELPICSKCKIPMDIHKTIAGDRYTCDNYHLCGQSIAVEKYNQNKNGKNN